MNDDQLLRYSRHIMLDEIGIEGQERILAAHALIIGAGGLGSPAAMFLASAGVGTLTLVDEAGTPLPPGSSVLHEQGQVPTVVGWDGVVYLTALQRQNTLQARTPDGSACSAAFSEAEHAASSDLRVVCRTAGSPTEPGARPAAGAARKGAP